MHTFYDFDESQTHGKYNRVIRTNKIDFEEDVNKMINTSSPREHILIEIDNTTGITKEMIMSIPDYVSIRITGGYSMRFMSGLKKPNQSMLWEKVTYSKDELLKFLTIFEEVENNMIKRWDHYDKALYIYDYLKKRIRYHKIHRIERMNVAGMSNHGREFDSLMGLISGEATSLGLSLIFQEMLTRQGITCVQIGGVKTFDRLGRYSWNVVTVGEESFAVDLSIDIQEFEKGNDQIIGFGQFDTTDYIPKSSREIFEKITDLEFSIIQKKLRKVRRKKRKKSSKSKKVVSGGGRKK